MLNKNVLKLRIFDHGIKKIETVPINMEMQKIKLSPSPNYLCATVRHASHALVSMQCMTGRYPKILS